MGKHDEFVLHGSAAARLKTKLKVAELLCFRCGEELQVGEVVHHGGSRIYHPACFEATYVDGALSIRKDPSRVVVSRP